MQLFTLALLSITLLHLNRIMFYQIATLPISLVIGMIVNDIWMLRKTEGNKSLEETDREVVIVQPRWITMSWEQIVRACFASLIVGMVLIAGYRVDMSLSNLGELNGLSVLIGFAIDQIAMRPVIGLIIIGCFKLVELVVGREQMMEYRVLREMLHQ